MNWQDVRILYLRELRSALRERAIIINSIVIPIVLYPLLIWIGFTGFTFISGQNEQIKSHVALQGLPETHVRLREAIAADKTIEIRDSADPKTDLQRGTLDAWVQIVPEIGSPTDFTIRIMLDGSRDSGTTARNRLTTIIDRYRDQYLKGQATRFGMTDAAYEGFRVEGRNVSTSAEMGRFVLGLLLPVIIIAMLGVGAMYPAIDTTAGERENGTWETLMTLATPRANILIAKYLYVATMSFVAGTLNVTAMVFSMRALLGAAVPRGTAPASLQVPLAAIPVLIAGAALLALFIAAAMMILAAFARTFKEGQSLVGPFYIVLIFPITFIQGPAQEFTTRLALIPIVNVAMMFRQALMGSYSWRLIGLTVAVEGACILLALRLAGKILANEDFVMGSYSGTFSKFFSERILRR